MSRVTGVSREFRGPLCSNSINIHTLDSVTDVRSVKRSPLRIDSHPMWVRSLDVEQPRGTFAIGQ